MKVLIVHAHPESKSFCSSLKNIATKHFYARGHDVKKSNLYLMNFNPVGGPQDFSELENSDYFKYQMEQVHAYQNGGFEKSLKDEMDKLEWCDLLIFNFPMWWFGMPAILKGWVDRVFAMGFTYGAGKGVYDSGTFRNKKALLCITTGGPKEAYGAEGRNGDLETILFPIHHGIFYFNGMTVLPPFVSYSPVRITEEERSNEIQRYKEYLDNLDNLEPLYQAKNEL